MVNPRKLAANILIKIENDGAYSNLALNSFFKDCDISSQDKAFVTTLVYGVIERKITIDYVLRKFIKTTIKKIQDFTLANLRLAIYQILFLDKIPESAAVNEAVKLVKNSKESRNSGFVNAVLRNVLREDNLMPTGDRVEDLSIIYSCPVEVINSFINDYGIENAKSLLQESLKPAPITVRVNTLKCSVNDFVDKIGVETEVILPEGAVLFKKGISVSNCNLYNNGYYFVEDTASQTAVLVLSPQKGERMLDMCAAPGGKTFASAILMENVGEIISCDLYSHKVSLIENGAKRLGLDIISPLVCDATEYNPDLGKFDCILCDVPCSGLGIIRRKPEIKYKNPAKFEDLPALQYTILTNAVKYLKKGGRILYSTCTLRKAENEKVIERFLKENNNFTLQ